LLLFFKKEGLASFLLFSAGHIPSP